MNAAGEFEAAATKIKALKREMGAAVDAVKAGRSAIRLTMYSTGAAFVLGICGTLLVDALT